MNSLQLIYEMLRDSGPVGVAVIALFAWFSERRETRKLQQSLLELAQSQVQASVKHEQAVSSLKDLVEHISRR